MTTPDLSHLHDFYQPPPPSWTPQTIGWYVLFALLVLFAIWMIARALSHWLANRYRREALVQLQTASVNQLSALLKRTAMVTRPRAQVASLSGKPWLAFLSKSSANISFQSAPGSRIEDVALTQEPVTPEDEQRLRQLASDWVRSHHV
jgi:Domain of unknown function (DUF4381)